MQTESPNINDLIEQLLTEEGKLAATIKALEKGVPVNPKYTNQVIEYLKSIGAYDLALKLSRSFEEAERALSVYDPDKRKALDFLKKSEDILLSNIRRSGGGRGLAEMQDTTTQRYIEWGESAENQGNLKDAAYYYGFAIQPLILGGNFVDAFKLIMKEIVEGDKEIIVPQQWPDFDSAVGRAFRTKRPSDIYVAGIIFYERTARFVEAGELEMIRGNPQRAQMYRTLDTMLKAS